MAQYSDLPFRPADILLPRNCNLGLWSVVACDQYTSEPSYWKRVEDRVGEAPSALRLILPESRLNGGQVERDIAAVHASMDRYLDEGLFARYPSSLIYVERTLRSGKVRRGLVGALDLEAYDYRAGTHPLIRSTEGTVLSRIPPRVAVRRNASLEIPHVIVLTDDPGNTVIEPLSDECSEMEELYRFTLMEGAGSICGWLLTEQQKERVEKAFCKLGDPSRDLDGDSMLLAVGDGNHSLAAAKACWEEIKATLAPEKWEGCPARYALVEIENLRDPVLEFEPIHRVVFGICPEKMLDALNHYCPCGNAQTGAEHRFECVWGEKHSVVTVKNPTSKLPVGTLQSFLDSFLAEQPNARIDYVHGEDVARRLARQPNAAAFLLPALGKEELFPSVLRDGALPRKTFSMGEAHDKRFYLEARSLRR